MTLTLLRSANPRRMLTCLVWESLVLSAAAAEVVLIAPTPDPPCGPIPDDHVLSVSGDPTKRELIAALRREPTDAVVSISDPDSRVASDMKAVSESALGRRPLAQAQAVAVALDKARTREVVGDNAPFVPGGTLNSGDIRRPIPGLPCVVKDPAGWGGRGVYVCRDEDMFRRALAQTGVPCVVEDWVDGEEVSVEVVRYEGVALVSGWVLKGPTTSSAHPLARLRYAPAVTVPDRLAGPAVRLVEALGLEGVAEVEFVVADEPLITEINPRPSGVTALIAASCGQSSLSMLCELSAGRKTGGGARPRHAVDVAFSPDARARELVRRMPTLHYLHSSPQGFPPRAFLASSDPEEMVEALRVVCGDWPEQLLRRVAAAARLSVRPS